MNSAYEGDLFVRNGRTYLIKRTDFFRRFLTLIFKDYKLFNGLSIELYDTGELLSVSCYKDGVQHGYFREYYKTGELKYRSNYIAGDKVGESIGYYTNGNIRRRYDIPENDENINSIFYTVDGEIDFTIKNHN